MERKCSYSSLVSIQAFPCTRAINVLSIMVVFNPFSVWETDG